MTRIPVTGIGVVAPDAIGVEAFRRLLAEGRTAIAAVERFDTAGLGATKAALVRDFKPKDFINPMKMRRMNMLSRLGVSAAKMAIDDCGAKLEPDTGVAMGTSFGPVQTSIDYMEEYVAKGAALAPPQLFAESVANAPGSHVAIEWGLRGFNVTVTQRESSGLAAAMYAAAQLVKGSAGAALIGGIEEINEMIFAVLDRINALTSGVAHPFDRNRDGMSAGEGSAVLVAGAGSRKPYGWLAGFGIARDTTATVTDWGTGHESVVAAMQGALDDAGIAPGQVDAVYASANGSRRVDAMECRALETLFADRLPAIVATKGVFGEYAAGGMLQLAAALIALDEQKLHPSVGSDDPEIPVNREYQPADLRYILVNSLSAGGGIVSAVLARDEA